MVCSIYHRILIISKLDSVVCGKYRTGILCSKCRDNFATHYHHNAYACKSKNCRWGWLFYIVSEIIPVTLFFFIIVVLNVKLTSGTVNGFILFIQLSNTMHLTDADVSSPGYALKIYFFVSRIFNLNFFAVDSLSFCLWENATVIDLIAFKYTTIFFSLALVVIIIVILKFNSNKYLNKIIRKLRSGNIHSTKSALIHGISGFLVICYSECTRITLILLTFTYLRGRPSGNFIHRAVSFYNGELEYFHGKHLLYALPALLIFITMCILPPLLLLSYPLCYKLLAILKISESKFARTLCIIIPLEKFRPLFDSFQGSFKDNYRFFSGLYFLYRFTTMLTFAIQSDLTAYYLLIQVQLLFILAMHAICQPYRKHSHNLVDTLLFINLSAINITTLYLSLNLPQNKIAHTVQVILLYLPLLCAVIYFFKGMLLSLKITPLYKRLTRKRDFDSTSLDDYHELSRTFTLNAAENRLKV